jgi:REP element-mobilizing transposase RayT
MRRARITYEGAFHHVMNRGINGEDIFTGNKLKGHFLNLLEETSKKMKIRIFAYCIMTNHYHLVLENSSGQMSEFCKQLNGQFGMYYRISTGGHGYVFQSRYKSTLIQDDSYLRMAIAYVLLNPLRAKIVGDIREYVWSSFNCYFIPHHHSTSDTNTGIEDHIVDITFVEELFGTKKELLGFLSSQMGKELPERKTRYGYILGDNDFLDDAQNRFDRRDRTEDAIHRKRIDDRYFEPVEKVFMEFEHIKGIKIEDIERDTWEGKRLRGELLVYLKDLTELPYTEIIKLDIFSDLQCSSLAPIYRNTKKRLSAVKQKRNEEEEID